jgi:predicted DNA-binding transcriptional regulator AlpA
MEENEKRIELDDGMRFIGTKEVAQLMGCSVPIARQIMRRRDFPLIMCGKNLKVMKSEFIKWASERRV